MRTGLVTSRIEQKKDPIERSECEWKIEVIEIDTDITTAGKILFCPEGPFGQSKFCLRPMIVCSRRSYGS